jgi:hypothetical protein
LTSTSTGPSPAITAAASTIDARERTSVTSVRAPGTGSAGAPRSSDHTRPLLDEQPEIAAPMAPDRP